MNISGFNTGNKGNRGHSKSVLGLYPIDTVLSMFS